MINIRFLKSGKKIFLILMVALIYVSCKEEKKQEIPNDTSELQEEVDVKAIETTKMKADSIQLAKIADSITQDSLRQVKEHGHAH